MCVWGGGVHNYRQIGREGGEGLTKRKKKTKGNYMSKVQGVSSENDRLTLDIGRKKLVTRMKMVGFREVYGLIDGVIK